MNANDINHLSVEELRRKARRVSSDLRWMREQLEEDVDNVDDPCIFVQIRLIFESVKKQY